jgi:predicted dehydrogenase
VTDAKRIRVGIIGANPDRGWAAQAHIPALKSLSHDFEITALSVLVCVWPSTITTTS